MFLTVFALFYLFSLDFAVFWPYKKQSPLKYVIEEIAFDGF